MSIIDTKIYFDKDNQKDIRRICLPKEITLNVLVTLIKDSHPWVDLRTSDIKYQDEDKEWVQLSTEADWAMAKSVIANNKIPLRMTISNNRFAHQPSQPNQDATQQPQQQQQQQQEQPNAQFPFGQGIDINQLISTYGPMFQSYMQNLKSQAPNMFGSEQMRSFDPSKIQEMLQGLLSGQNNQQPQNRPSARDFRTELDQLFAMGFGDVATNTRLLEKYDGDVNMVVQDLMNQ
ncbi:hypothetical protein AKO1_006066 [Acrasis kona]|uniref:UBA domain-containing protein n=1 Tax=Acrasis kona TaxID=1008807 RepID=A0AAW2YGW8_9EUKA